MLYAIKTAPQETRWQDMLAVWQAADAMPEFHSAWNFDHFYPINVPDTSGPCLEAWTTLSALAQATQRIRIGCMVTGVPYRHPALLANMISAVDIISQGRLELGLGAGWSEEECAAYGIELGPLKQRFDRFDEALAVIHAMMTQDVTNFDGAFFQLTNAHNNPLPLQKPHPPICIGGNGEKRTLPNVARYAQHWNYAGFDLEGWLEKKAVLARICHEQGRDPATIMTSIHQRVDEGNLEALAESCRQFRDAGLDLMIFYLPPPHTPVMLEPLAQIARDVG
ncbi:MAG: LLM class F420-dependent oxidoreductase [Sphingomonadales bacterium]